MTAITPEKRATCPYANECRAWHARWMKPVRSYPLATLFLAGVTVTSICMNIVLLFKR